VRLLVVDRNAALRHLLAGLFIAAGHEVDTSGDAGEVDAARHDLVLLDMGVADAAAALSRSRDGGVNVPILAGVSGRDPETRIAALDAGADAVMVKPYASDELQARVRALLRRPPTLPRGRLAVGNISLDAGAQAVRVNGGTVAMTRGEIALLETLMRHAARPVARESLEAAIHSFSSDLSANAIEAAISRVRRRLDDAGARVTISAARGIGYLLSERTA
jgi:DNA-binding response OmpR family regulator